MQAEVAVIGGGPAGLQAALELVQGGAQVTLVDDQPELGGHLRYRKQAGTVPPIDRATPGAARVEPRVSKSFPERIVSGCTKEICWVSCRRVRTRARSSG